MKFVAEGSRETFSGRRFSAAAAVAMVVTAVGALMAVKSTIGTNNLSYGST